MGKKISYSFQDQLPCNCGNHFKNQPEGNYWWEMLGNARRSVNTPSIIFTFILNNRCWNLDAKCTATFSSNNRTVLVAIPVLPSASWREENGEDRGLPNWCQFLPVVIKASSVLGRCTTDFLSEFGIPSVRRRNESRGMVAAMRFAGRSTPQRQRGHSESVTRRPFSLHSLLLTSPTVFPFLFFSVYIPFPPNCSIKPL